MTRYRVADGEREVILPTGIARSPRGDNARYTAGETFEVDTDNPEIAPHMRYIRRLIASGDLVEETETPPAQPAPAQPAAAPAPTPPPTEPEGGSS